MSNRQKIAVLAIAAPALSLILTFWPLARPAASAARPSPDSVITRLHLDVVSDLPDRAAKFKRVEMPFNRQGLSPREIQLVDKLVHAAGLLDCIYWRQSDPDALYLYKELIQSTDPQDEMLARYLKINGSRFDLIDDEKPFLGTDLMPPGRGFYTTTAGQEPTAILSPKESYDDRVARLKSLLEGLAKQNKQVISPYTLVAITSSESGASLVQTTPYSVAFREFLKLAAQDLRDAAKLSRDPAFAKFLRLRAQALLTDNYYASDLAWLDLDNPKIDVVFAPYETYLDSLLGVKTSYGASVMIRNEEESRKLAVYQKYIPELQESLPLAPADLPSKRGRQTPMEVMDSPYRSGDLLHGYQAVADNLPNDPRIHEEKGTKKIFWKNFMDARVNYIVLPLAKRVMPEDQAAMASGEGYLADTLMHEISHDLGPAFARTAANPKTDIREAIGSGYSGLEEAKADVVGELCIDWLVNHGAIPKEKQNAIYASYVAGIFRTIRFGIAEAHGAAEMMEFSYLTEQGAIRRDVSTGRYEVVFEKMPAAIASLAKELLEQEATGDRARTQAWFKKYAVLPRELSDQLAKASDIPVDVDPEFSFQPQVR
jgi:hypothetical protein